MTSFTEGRHPANSSCRRQTYRSRDTITVASGSGKIAPGMVLGKVTIGGSTSPRSTPVRPARKTAVAVALYACDATSADQSITAITRDAEIKAAALTYGSTIDDDTKKQPRAQLAAVGIICR